MSRNISCIRISIRLSIYVIGLSLKMHDQQKQQNRKKKLGVSNRKHHPRCRRMPIQPQNHSLTRTSPTISIQTLTILQRAHRPQHPTHHRRTPIGHTPSPRALHHRAPKALQIVSPAGILLVGIRKPAAQILVQNLLVGANAGCRSDELAAVGGDEVCAGGVCAVGSVEHGFEELLAGVPGRAVVEAGGAGGAEGFRVPEGEEAGSGREVLRYARAHVPGVVHVGLQEEGVVCEAGGGVVVVVGEDVVEVGFAFAAEVGDFVGRDGDGWWEGEGEVCL